MNQSEENATARSLRNIEIVRTELRPVAAVRATATALAFQIRLREMSLRELRLIRVRLAKLVASRETEQRWRASGAMGAARRRSHPRGRLGGRP